MNTTYRIGVFANELNPDKLTWCVHAKNPRESIKKALELTRKCGKFMVFDWYCPPTPSILLLVIYHDDSDVVRDVDNILERLGITANPKLDPTKEV